MGRLKKRWQWIVAVVAIALVIGWKEKRCQSQAHQCTAAYVTQLPSGLAVEQRASAQQAITAACEPDGYFCRLFSAANLPSVFLVFIGICGIYAAIRTLEAIEGQVAEMKAQREVMNNQLTAMQGQLATMESQTQAAKEGTVIAKTSADAAKASADAVINSERARVVIEFVQKAAIYSGQWHRIEPYGPVLLTTEEVLKGKHLNYELKITNIGRTPAELFELQIGWGALIEGKQFFAEEL